MKRIFFRYVARDLIRDGSSSKSPRTPRTNILKSSEYPQNQDQPKASCVQAELWGLRDGLSSATSSGV
ncbi:Uncharacterized protein TCM_030016 [Theobroma cacao]|uniref:Uncharacterized protein n=1 Tax=Theobroma cacao TaxID=3641 RepID=A0A061GH15_THECC|nr:Uncharacterized protein TCM_030016 [Theobroma cacao]